MSSHAQDQSTQKAAAASSQAASAQQIQQANDNQKFGDASRATMFGTAGPDGKLSGGTVSQFLDPNSLNVTGPTGPYKSQYNAELNTLQKGTQDALATSRQSNASRGGGMQPAGFQQDQERKALQDQAGQNANLFAGNATNSYNDALQNFWNANNTLAAQGGNALGISNSGVGSAAGNYSNLYSTASTPVQNPWMNAVGAVSGLAGAAGGVMSGVGALKGKGK